METGYDIIFFWVARMMMLGHRADRARAVPHGLPVGADPRPVRPEDVEDEGQRRRPARGHRRGRRRRAALRPDPRRDARQRPAVRAGEARARPELRQQALERDALRAGRAAGVDRGGRRAAPPGSRAHLGPAERWIRSRAAATTAAVDAAFAGYQLRRGHPALYDGDLVRVLRLGHRAREGPAGRRARSPDEREATWWTLVEALDTYLRLLHPVMPFVTEAIWGALPHRAGDPELLIVARWPGVGHGDALGRGGCARARRARPRRSATPARRRGSPAADWLRDSRLRRRSSSGDVRGAAPGHRAAGARPAADARS